MALQDKRNPMTKNDYLRWGELELIRRQGENDMMRRRLMTFPDVKARRDERRERTGLTHKQAMTLLNSGPYTTIPEREYTLASLNHGC